MKIKTYRYYLYYAACAATFLVKLVPIRTLSALAGVAGEIVFNAFKKERKTALRNLKASFPEKKEEEIVKIAKASYVNAFKSFAEFINISKINKQNIGLWVKPHGMERIDKALSEGKGAIVLTAHFGHWELVGAYLRMMGYPGAIIAKRIYFHKYNKYLMNLRKINDVNAIYRDESPKKALKLLKENKILGILADQDIDSIEGVFVNFFGKPAYTPTAPVKFAMASGAPIVPCYMAWEKDKYNFFVEEPIFAEKTKDRDEAVKLYTQKWTDILEKYVRRYPEQWVWMHERWKTKPKS